MLPTMAILLIMGSSSNPISSVEHASSVYRWVAAGYIVSLLLAALFSYLLWVAGNKVQETMSREADEKIQESRERIAELNKQSETLKADAAAARVQIVDGNAEAARANAQAAKANERADRLELETAKQREKTAEAERALLELQERIKDRHLTTAQRAAIAQKLASAPKGRISVSCLGGTLEPCAYAAEFVELLRSSGWGVNPGGPPKASWMLEAHPLE